MDVESSRRVAGTLLLVLSSLPLGACSSSQLGTTRSSDAIAPGGALLTVDNQHVLSMRVYLIRGAVPIPLGSVDTLERRTFALPTSILGHGGAIRLMVDPLGSRRTFTSGWIQAGPGDHVEWKLAASLELSSFFVRSAASR